MLRPGGRSRSRCLLLAWCAIPREPGRRRNVWVTLKALGVVGLVVLLAIFRGERGPAEFPIVGRVENWAWLRPAGGASSG